MPVNHPAPPLNVLAANMLSMAQYGLLGSIFFDVSLVPPALKENKWASCMGIFFVGNMFSSALTKTNAFEIYLDEKLLWSSLKTERKPSLEDLTESFRNVGITLQA